MFGSTILDLAIGLIFSFLLISLITSTATEAVASAFSWRADTLLTGVKDLLNDPNFTGLARTLYNHGLVNPRADGQATTEANLTAKPSYIDAKQFAAALTQSLNISPGVADLQAQVNNIQDPQLKAVIGGIVKRADGNLYQIHQDIADWFDQNMDRVAGVYKRYAQKWNFVIALVLAVLLNLDAVKIAHVLWDQPMLVKDLAPVAGQTAADALKQMQDSNLPFGWDTAAIGYFSNPATGLSQLLGWLIMAASTLFGASFWFDALQRITQLRGAGSK
jgi:hypothetical protein